MDKNGTASSGCKCVKSIFYKKVHKKFGGGKNLCEITPCFYPVSVGVISYKFLPPPNFYVFSYKEWTLYICTYLFLIRFHSVGFDLNESNVLYYRMKTNERYVIRYSHRKVIRNRKWNLY